MFVWASASQKAAGGWWLLGGCVYSSLVQKLNLLIKETREIYLVDRRSYVPPTVRS